MSSKVYEVVTNTVLEGTVITIPDPDGFDTLINVRVVSILMRSPYGTMRCLAVLV